MNLHFVAHATTIELFGALHNSLGTFSVDGSPDPVFTGGILGVESSIPFLSANVTFNTAAAPPHFAFDNLRLEAVPEPASLLLLGSGLGVLGLAGWRRKR